MIARHGGEGRSFTCPMCRRAFTATELAQHTHPLDTFRAYRDRLASAQAALWDFELEVAMATFGSSEAALAIEDRGAAIFGRLMMAAGALLNAERDNPDRAKVES